MLVFSTQTTSVLLHLSFEHGSFVFNDVVDLAEFMVRTKQLFKKTIATISPNQCILLLYSYQLSFSKKNYFYLFLVFLFSKSLKIEKKEKMFEILFFILIEKFRKNFILFILKLKIDSIYLYKRKNERKNR